MLRTTFALTLLLPNLFPGAAFSDSRYLTQPEDILPVLQQYSQDPFRYPGIWSPEARDPFEADLHPAAVAERPLPQAAAAPVEKGIGGRQAPTESFQRKMRPLRTAEPVIKSASTALTPESDPAAVRFNALGAPEGITASAPHFLRPYLLMTASFLSKGRRVFPGECEMRYRSANESEVLQLWEEVELEAGSSEGVKRGDMFKVYDVGEDFASYTSRRNLGKLVQVKGMVEVLRVGTRRSVARLVRCFGTISRDSRAAPMGDLPVVRAAGYSALQGQMRMGRVVWVTPPNQIPQPFSQVIIDEGTNKGFQVGDFVFLFNQRNGKMTDKVLGNAVVLRVEDHAATLLLQGVEPGVINSGDFVVASMAVDP